MAVGTWFATDLDEPAVAADLPVEVTSGREPAVAILDQMVRGDGIVGRVAAGSGSVVVRVRPVDGPVQVAVTVQLDDAATWWWAERVRADPAQAERPRLVLLRSQGRVRAATVLARRQGWLHAAGAGDTMVFELAADELRDGLLVVELTGAAAPLPDWASSRLSVDGPIGVRVDRIDVRPCGTGAAPSRPVAGAHSCLLALTGGQPQSVSLAVRGVLPAPPPPRVPSNRWTRQRPARAGFKLLRLARRVAGVATAAATPTLWTTRRLRCHAVDLVTGAAVPVSTERRGPGRLDVRVDAAACGPVLLGLVDPRGVRAERFGRQPACQPVGGGG